MVEMFLCIDKEYSYGGAVVRVMVYVSSEELCKEIEGVAKEGYGALMGFMRRHGGCRILSENPLKVLTRDEKVLVVAEPKSSLARMFWGMAVERIKSIVL